MDAMTYRTILQTSGGIFLIVFGAWFCYKMMVITKSMTKIED